MFSKIALSVHLDTLFEYQVPDAFKEHLKVGMRVEVPFRNQHQIGIVASLSEKSELPTHKIKSIRKVLDNEPIINADILRLCQFANNYYHYPIGEIIMTALPKRLREGHPAVSEEEVHYSLTDQVQHISTDHFKRAPKKQKLFDALSRHDLEVLSHLQLLQLGFTADYIRQFLADDLIKYSSTDMLLRQTESALTLNTEQQDCFDTISAYLDAFKVFLLDGVTGSGKTEIYLQTIAKVIATGKQALVLVPEISLTPQTISRFEKRFSDRIAVIHSSLSDKARCNQWLYAQTGKAKIIIGTRSALLTPFQNLGLIIIDEEHDQSFKQQDQFRYSSRDLAIVLAKQLNIPIVLGSATPSIETLFKAKQKKYEHLKLSSRVNDQTLPEIKVIDCRRQKLDNGLSQQMINEVKACLERGEQAMLFINRRGYSPVLMCQSCGWFAECDRCDTKMTYHREPYFLQCHHCLKQIPLPQQCPECENPQLSTVGLGTQRLEEGLHTHFANYPILRLDRDNAPTQKKLDDLFNQIKTGQPLIMVGTQLIAKGHHFPNVTLVGIVDTDNALYSAEFRAIEHMAQLITQVSGRAGREEKVGKVILQTYHPDNTYLDPLLNHDYHSLVEKLLIERDSAQLPPYTHLAVIRAEAHSLKQVFQFLNAILKKFPRTNAVEVMGPLPLNRPKRAGYFRGEIIFRSYARNQLQAFLKHIQIDPKLQRQVRWHLEVDPIYLLS